MKFRITYNEGDVINKTCEVEASCKAAAILLFWTEHAEASDMSKVERVQDEGEDD